MGRSRRNPPIDFSNEGYGYLIPRLHGKTRPPPMLAGPSVLVPRGQRFPTIRNSIERVSSTFVGVSHFKPDDRVTGSTKDTTQDAPERSDHRHGGEGGG